MDFRVDDVVVLLGAGASADAGIPHSREMVENIEEMISGSQPEWKKYRALYYFIKSSIYYSHGIHGLFDDEVSYNIESIVDTLNEISKRNRHALFPFVGAWNPALIEVAGKEFELIEEFRDAIVTVLTTEWLAVKNYDEAAGYYGGLFDLQRSIQHPLRVFSLNYDLCMERSARVKRRRLELGFNEERSWDWRLFDYNPQDPKDIYLYKLHGSMDWTYDVGQLTYHDEVSAIGERAIIFGTSYKLEYRDPFLFLTYEFRRWTLECQLIVVIGYGFGDEHINMIIQQALSNNEDRVLLAVGPAAHNSQPEQRRQEIGAAIDHCNLEQIKVSLNSAKEFLSTHGSKEFLREYLPDEDRALFAEVTES